ncbi:LytTR family DNA-binding domain-containing protein [Sporolactobacillus sp. KGMB 08714]|uniref:LytTR family DNA-binding domain-containing protein n=1 Tax=Sporolactobacillus sp. KGMB 08714 TaxID=3064704 RepID=UPI002FBE5179
MVKSLADRGRPEKGLPIPCLPENGGMNRGDQMQRNIPLLRKLAIATDERFLIVPFSDIMYIGADRGRTVVALRKKKMTVNETLVSLEKRLQPQSGIVRVHRAYLVNLEAVTEISPWFNSTYNLMLENGDKVPVSRNYAKNLRMWFKL